jgi:hypothetical protein
VGLIAIKSSPELLSVPRDIPEALLPPDMMELLRSERFSAFAGSRN